MGENPSNKTEQKSAALWYEERGIILSTLSENNMQCGDLDRVPTGQ